ncbi:MAG: NnrU family protein, partial [Pseudomonadota bacterium]
MTLIVLGLLLWSAAHMFKRIAPGARDALTEQIGDGSKGLFALLILGSVVLLVVGYRSTDTDLIYATPTWGVHLNNLLMFFAIALFGLANSKGRARSFFRHPMLLGFATWTVAHLIVNGDTASVVMFGGLLLW